MQRRMSIRAPALELDFILADSDRDWQYLTNPVEARTQSTSLPTFRTKQCSTIFRLTGKARCVVYPA